MNPDRKFRCDPASWTKGSHSLIEARAMPAVSRISWKACSMSFTLSERPIIDSSAGHQVLGFARDDAAADAVTRLGAEVHRGDLSDLKSLAAGDYVSFGGKA
jgi:hypothetical protein